MQKLLQQYPRTLCFYLIYLISYIILVIDMVDMEKLRGPESTDASDAMSGVVQAVELVGGLFISALFIAVLLVAAFYKKHINKRLYLNLILIIFLQMVLLFVF